METRPQVPRRAWWIAALLAVGIFVNYLDRVNLSVAYDALRGEWGVSDFQFGLLSSAYSWTYTAMQLPMGLLLDTLGVRVTGSIAAMLWSVASFGAAWSPGLRMFTGARLLLGVAEAPSFPASAKAVAEWFPRERRGLPTGMFDSAAKLGPAIGVPLLGALLVRHGWRWSFCFTGVISAVYFVLFLFAFRDRKRDDAGAAAPRANAVSFGSLLRNRNVIGLSLGFAGYGYSFYLFLTWLPAFLTRSLGMPLLHSAVATFIPWTCAALSSVLVGGALTDALIRRGFDATLVRKSIVCGGLALGLVSFGATQTHSPAAAIACLTVALAGLAASGAVGWQIPALISPPGSEARTGAVMNTANNLMAILAPVVTGALVQQTHSFVAPFAVAALMIFGGIASYLFVLGRITPPATEQP